MSDVIEAAVKAIGERIGGGFDGIARFEIEGEGAIIVDRDGAHADDGEAEVTLKADTETFKAILNGDLNPTAAFMQGRLAVEGDMSVAMRLGAALS